MTGDHQTLALVLFSAFVAVTLAITTWAGRRRRHRRGVLRRRTPLLPMENGFAIAGDYMSAASFLGISGLIALYGYDGMLYSVGFLVACACRPAARRGTRARNCGRFTLADVIAARMGSRGSAPPWELPRWPCPFSTWSPRWSARAASWRSSSAGRAAARSWTVVGVGALMIVYVSLGGMRATTWIQIVKAVLLMAGALTLTGLVLLRFHGDIDALLTTAADRSGHGRDSLAPGLAYGDRLDRAAGLHQPRPRPRPRHRRAAAHPRPLLHRADGALRPPLHRLVDRPHRQLLPDDDRARLRRRGPPRQRRAARDSNAAGNTAVPLLALHLGGGAGSTGGAVLFGVVAAVAFATILAVVAGITGLVHLGRPTTCTRRSPGAGEGLRTASVAVARWRPS